MDPILVLCRPSVVTDWQALAIATCHRDEHLRADRFAFEHLRRRYLCGRALVRHILAEKHNISPCDVRLDKTPKGQLIAPDSDVGMSLSYSEDLVGVLVGDGPLGLDLEYLDRTNDIRGVAGHAFRPEERAHMAQLQGNEEREYFFRIWCEKEAVSKALGTGMAVGFNTFDARAAASALGSRVDTFSLLERHLASVVVPVDAPDVRIVNWNGPNAKLL